MDILSEGGYWSFIVNSAVSKLRLLILEDSPSFRGTLQNYLSLQFHVTESSSVTQARELIASDSFDVAILDKQLPDGDGSELIRSLKQSNPNIAVIMLTADGRQASIQECLERGADDYAIKSSNIILELTVRIGMAIKKISDENRSKCLEQILNEEYKYEIIGSSDFIKDLKDRVQSQRGVFTPVLITGESGTGKELIARLFHKVEANSKRPFVTVNCAALSETLAESELFGHEKGSFTGAHERRVGFFELANGGDIFLDEIGELPLQLQAKLLRVIQEQEVQPVGSKSPKKINVRVIAATNRSLETQVKEKEFRADLYYRLNVQHVEALPLRFRLEDVEPIAISYIRQRYGSKISISQEVIFVLQEYEFPGNIRELRNILDRAFLSARRTGSSILKKNDIQLDSETKTLLFKSHVVIELPESSSDITSEDFRVKKIEIEKSYIENALKIFNGNTTKVAKQLGMARSTLWQKIKELKVAKELLVNSNNSLEDIL
ncbi:MAG: sigma-54-dependent Fis family transcriptional regulator [Xanthomonadaceae bacterium]|nr:sigma-54-dependent Fis family transcriptional regulator [Xanthomonadaceae bacterium]